MYHTSDKRCQHGFGTDIVTSSRINQLNADIGFKTFFSSALLRRNTLRHANL
jgi:hypothetical protein